MVDVTADTSRAFADRYTFERELGRGGMAIVYLARDVRHSRLVAVKVLNQDLGQALGAERFLREIEIAARLSHPYIVPLLDSGEADGRLFYTMSLVDGESLRQRLDRERQLPVEDALEITRQAASALSYAHSRDEILVAPLQPGIADVGLVFLANAPRGITPARLAERDMLDRSEGAGMIIVGYGTTTPRIRNAPPDTASWDGKRRFRTSTLRRVVDETWGTLVDTKLRLLRRFGRWHLPDTESSRTRGRSSGRQRERRRSRLPTPQQQQSTGHAQHPELDSGDRAAAPWRDMIGILLTCAALVPFAPLFGQSSLYSAELLSDLRRAAALSPGELPTAVRVASLNPFSIARSYMVEGGSTVQVHGANPVFQIRFPRGWIVVDASVDRALVSAKATFDDSTYRRIHLALRDARLVVVTHEHDDHVTGVIRSPYLAQIQRHTLLTRAQVRSLVEHPSNPKVRLDSATASRYLTIDFDAFIPVAPGVVLLKAAGHTPGSLMVYVRLASGQEVILAGDVAWHSSGIETQRQKPDSSTKDFGGEDRAAIAAQLRWLRDVSGPRTAVVVAHDAARIDSLVSRGVLRAGLDLARP